MAARAEVTEAIRERYAASGKVTKGVILDEFVAMTGVRRKHAIRMLTPTGSERRPRCRPKVRYGRAVTEALDVLWEASDRGGSARDCPGRGRGADRHRHRRRAGGRRTAGRAASHPSSAYRRVKPIPKRPSMMDPHRGEIDGWLSTEPAITAVDVLTRLKARYPDRFTDTHLRTTQRMVRTWRADQARHSIRRGTAALEAAMATVTLPPSL